MKRIPILIISIVYMGCITNTEEIDLPTEAVSFANDVQPIMRQNCDTCHSAGQFNFDSSSYQGILASVSASYGRNQVIPGNAANSPLVDKIESTNPDFGSRMPQGGQLSVVEIEAIKTWINEGALDN